MDWKGFRFEKYGASPYIDNLKKGCFLYCKRKFSGCAFYDSRFLERQAENLFVESEYLLL